MLAPKTGCRNAPLLRLAARFISFRSLVSGGYQAAMAINLFRHFDSDRLSIDINLAKLGE
jgi:hypothetical protein